MRKKAKILISLLVVLFITPVILLFVLSKVHHQTAHDELVDFINREFDGKITFKDFSFSYLNHFPRVHLNLQDISIKDDTKEIAKIGNLDILLNLKRFWKKRLNIEGLTVNDGELHLITDSLGHKAHIFGSKKKSSGSSPGALLINANIIRIHNSRLHFANEIKGNRSFFYIKESQLDLITQDSLLLLKGSLEGRLDSLISNNTTLFKGQPVEGREVVFTINRYSGEKILKEGYVMAHTLRLEPRFKMKPHEDGQLIELHISGEDNFDDVLSLFEFHTGINLIQVNPEAKLKISYNQKGFVNPFLRPYSELDFEISNAEFTGEDLPFPLKVGGIKGNYNNGEGHSPETSELQIDTIH
ncbi:MAG: AsmA family protein, partial [Bacteroidales bacterium]|nr:AsmA family protein [Bacteroidales bacterium]